MKEENVMTSVQRNQSEKTSVERVEQQAKHSIACAVDIFEGPDETWVVADMPGVKKSELHVELEHDELRIRANASGFFDDGKHVELARAFRLPPGIDADKVRADLKDGVLTLKLPKPHELKPRKIDVKLA